MASVFLGDLDDFIQPSQSCINPMFNDPKPSSGTVEMEVPRGPAKISLQMDLSTLDTKTTEPDLIKTSNSQAATVSLNDCLACSGCVTSAETVLITQQSAAEFLNTLSEKKYKMVVVSISPASRASIARHFQLPLIETHRKLVTFFKQLGVHMVFDTSSSADFALLEAREEFMARLNNKHEIPWKKPPVSMAVSCTETQYPQGGEETEPESHTTIPMLASACPGWVCYAEKSQPNALPYISTTKSPQQIMGTLIKQVYCPAKHAQIEPKEIYHVTIMPCYDKKLEASRKDFYNELLDATDVDSVLSSGEVLDLMREKGVNFMDLPGSAPTEDELAFSGISSDGSTLLSATNDPHSGSGGYLEYLFRFAAKKLFNLDIQGPLEYVTGRNEDFREVSLEYNGEKVLCFAQAFGFRNIQSIMTKLKRKKCPYQFVEIMACPSGCLNGGGQIKGANSIETKAIVKEVQAKSLERSVRQPEENPVVRHVYKELLRTDPFSAETRKLFHTRYHAVPKLELSNPLGIKW